MKPVWSSILQAETCQILRLAENPRWSRVWQQWNRYWGDWWRIFLFWTLFWVLGDLASEERKHNTRLFKEFRKLAKGCQDYQSWTSLNPFTLHCLGGCFWDSLLVSAVPLTCVRKQNRAHPFSPVTGVCNLSTLEKFIILTKPQQSTLNKREEIFGTSRHKKVWSF